MLIARLIADPDSLQTRLDHATRSFAEAGLQLANAQMLDACGDVLQLELASDDLAALRKVIDDSFGPCDALLARDAVQVPHLFVSDMDSTMIGQECIDELADFAGLKDKIAEITERAMLGELDFESALRERVGLLKGLEEGAIDRCLNDRIKPTPGARTLVQTLKERGCRTVLVTGGFHHFADAVGDWIGFDRVVGNRLDVRDGSLTGKLLGSITDSSTKKQVLLEELAQLGAEAACMGAGDGANDIPMLQAATYGIAYRAKPKARDAANGWIDRGELTNLLKLLEIPEAEWVAG